jgi:hypothetical protein
MEKRPHRLAAALLLAAAVTPWAGAQEPRIRRLPAQVMKPVAGQLTLADPKPRAGHADLRRVFEIGPDIGYRDVVRFTVGRPGRVTADVMWKGGSRLALVLNAPGHGRSLARVDGVSPLHLEIEATRELLAVSAEWTLSIVDLHEQGRAVGRVHLQVPAQVVKLADLPVLDAARLRDLLNPAAPPPSAGVEHTILPNGEVQARYPDGRVVIYHACGQTTIFPDGTTQKFLCNQVQSASLPPTPTDPSLKAFLENHCDHLLQHIARLVDLQQQQVDLYLQFEGSKAGSLYERIQMRTQLIDKLLLE